MINKFFHSKTSLFLMEMIISLLVLSLASCICVQIFAASKTARKQAREWNHIQEMTVTAGEFLEGYDISSNMSSDISSEISFEADSCLTNGFLNIFPDGISDQESLFYYYDRQWNPADQENYHYCLQLIFSSDTKEKNVILTFYEKETILYEQKISFPIFSSGEEVAAS